MLTSDTEKLTLQAEPSSFRRLLLAFLLPLLLLVIATPLARSFVPPLARQKTPVETEAAASANAIPAEGEREETIQEAHRKAALFTIGRLERAAHLGGGEASIALIDLKRLKNALPELK